MRRLLVLVYIVMPIALIQKSIAQNDDEITTGSDDEITTGSDDEITTIVPLTTTTTALGCYRECINGGKCENRCYLKSLFCCRCSEEWSGNFCGAVTHTIIDVEIFGYANCPGTPNDYYLNSSSLFQDMQFNICSIATQVNERINCRLFSIDCSPDNSSAIRYYAKFQLWSPEAFPALEVLQNQIRVFCQNATHKPVCSALDLEPSNMTVIERCLSFTCMHNGTCTNSKNTGGFNCSCEYPYYGSRCEFKILDEDDAPDDLRLAVVLAVVLFIILVVGLMVIYKLIRAKKIVLLKQKFFTDKTDSFALSRVRYVYR